MAKSLFGRFVDIVSETSRRISDFLSERLSATKPSSPPTQGSHSTTPIGADADVKQPNSEAASTPVAAPIIGKIISVKPPDPDPVAAPKNGTRYSDVYEYMASKIEIIDIMSKQVHEKNNLIDSAEDHIRLLEDQVGNMLENVADRELQASCRNKEDTNDASSRLWNLGFERANYNGIRDSEPLESRLATTRQRIVSFMKDFQARDAIRPSPHAVTAAKEVSAVEVKASPQIPTTPMSSDASSATAAAKKGVTDMVEPPPKPPKPQREEIKIDSSPRLGG